MKAVVRILATSALLLASCSTVKVNHDYDREADFTTLKTYSWAPAPAGPAGGPRAASTSHGILDKRIRHATDRQLAAKGFTRTEQRPDFLVAFHVGARQTIDVGNLHPVYGRYGRLHRDVNVRQSDEGILVLDVIDARSTELVWRGVATKPLDPTATSDERALVLDETIAKMLADFPPRRD